MSTFQHIRLELAREPDHPRGSASTGYDLVAPLDAEGRLDPAALKAAPERSHVRRFVDDATVATGRLRHADDGRWILDLDPRTSPASAWVRRSSCWGNMSRC